jgi:hypothetical protein
MSDSRFKKGQSGNPLGKKKGTLNKTTRKAKEAFVTVMELLESRMTDREDVISKLSPAKAAELYLGILQYVKPKLNKNQNDTDVTGEITIKVTYSDDNILDNPEISGN